MRVGTFNLLHGLAPVDGPPDGSVDTDRLRAAVASLDTDLLGLQEVDVAQPRSDGVHQVRECATALDAAWWCFAPSVLGVPGEAGWRSATSADDTGDHCAQPHYGVGLVSRLPVLRHAVTRFTAAPLSLPLLVPSSPRPRVLLVRDEPRAAIAAVVETAAGPVTVVTAHLSFVPGWNVRQLRALRARLASWPRPLLLLGDLNLPWGLPARLTGWQSLLDAPTYPAAAPRIQFDHVLADGLPAAVVNEAVATVHSLPVSDHAAATVDLPL